MNTHLTRTLPAAAVLAAVVAVSASTGAVAGALITGADIKNGTVTSADIKNKTITAKDVKDGALNSAHLSPATLAGLQGGSGPAGPTGPAGQTGPKGDPGPAGVSGLQHVVATKAINAGTGGNVQVACPAGKKILGVSGDWTTSVQPAAASISATLLTGSAYGFNDTDSTMTLRATATCATVD
ncbi:uncharacterized protein YjbI with pentapeptide repeats [Nocardioides cavernae]|uniref:Uncharacterized protein YjbI with pentapeptide repeats n=1 Tax=Nocardioides cavernae TaxID=1921566 RepID=A0A7Y9KQY0_9ACTN|nr:collagen-like protein [Nocardioides cavernae]NYE36070.1 uncharacterized protein YjbI with pentapeptide repeats [Nocardioides cavernae]